MVYIKLTALFSILSLAAAAPASDSSSSGPSPYTFLALRSASPIHFSSLNAAGGKIWLGKETSSYCPVEQVGSACPSGKVTAFWIGETGGASMAVTVPGGQALYIDPTGALSYTQAHSAYIPTGSIVDGFQIKDSSSIGQGVVTFSNTKGAFLACPADHKGNGPWKVYVDLKHKLKSKNVPSGNKRDCLGFTAVGGQYTAEPYGAWQYA